MQKTFLMIKPDAVQRNLIGKIIEKIEEKGFMINALKFIKVSEEQAQKHYLVHKGKPFYDSLLKSVTSGPVVVMVISGTNAVKILRSLAGATNPLESCPGTIRGDFSNDIRMNIVHTSDSEENAQYEIGVYFSESEILNYNKELNKNTYSDFS